MRIEKHIGIFEDAVNVEACSEIIKLFDYWKVRKHTYSRGDKSIADDEQLNVDPTGANSVDLFFEGALGSFVTPALSACYDKYCDKYAALQKAQPHTFFQSKLQKTLPSQGYHTWHFENDGYQYRHRLTAFMLYLNDVEDGGETEFLYESVRIKPKAGTILIFPVSYTHTHRGNPPLSGEKYILTGWSEFR
jgi:hypothetical protein